MVAVTGNQVDLKLDDLLIKSFSIPCLVKRLLANN